MINITSEIKCKICGITLAEVCKLYSSEYRNISLVSRKYPKWCYCSCCPGIIFRTKDYNILKNRHLMLRCFNENIVLYLINKYSKKD